MSTPQSRGDDVLSGDLALVVGGRGFIGRFIVAELRRQGWCVRCLARPHGRALAATDIAGDITRMLTKEDWMPAIAGVSVVVNAAGILRETGSQRFEIVHCRAPLALAQACSERHVRFVQISVLGHPDDGGFVASKHQFDSALLALPLDAVVLRPSIVYSSRGSYGGTSLLRALAAFPWRQVLPGDGHWLVQPVGAKDFARIVVAACARGEAGVYEVGCKEPLPLREYQQVWRQWLDIPGAAAWCVPLAWVDIGVRLCQKLGRGPVNRTIWSMLQRGNVTAPDAHARVASAFGINVASLHATLALEPSQTQDRWSALLYFMAPWLRWSVIALWLWSGIVGLMTPPAAVESVVHGSALMHLAPVGVVRAAALVDVLLGGWLALARQRRPAVLVMLLVASAYLVAGAVLLPHAWMLPFGGLVKNVVLIPALAVLWVMSEHR